MKVKSELVATTTTQNHFQGCEMQYTIAEIERAAYINGSQLPDQVMDAARDGECGADELRQARSKLTAVPA